MRNIKYSLQSEAYINELGSRTMSNYDNLLLDNQLCFALYAATNAITKSYRPKLKKVGLTYPQYLVLVVLWESDGLSIKGLMRLLKLDTGTLTPLVKRMEKAGLLTRVRSQKDERFVNVFLTNKGNNLRHRVADIQKQVACDAGLTTSAFFELRDTLRKLSESLAA